MPHAITSRKGGYVLVFKFVRVDKVHLTTGLLTFKLYMLFSNIQDIATPVERTKFGINSKQTNFLVNRYDFNCNH